MIFLLGRRHCLAAFLYLGAVFAGGSMPMEKRHV
jgi:hypothetical protein